MSAPKNYVVLAQNEHWIIVDKPAEWLTTPGRTGENDTRPCLGVKLQEDLNQKVFPVHRLDFEVSGILLYALSAECHKDCNGAFAEREIEKTYHAISEGPLPPPGPLRWRSMIVRGKKRSYERPFGKPSETMAQYLGDVILSKDTRRRWELKPLTGRPHQLRFEMAKHGFPIVGDQLYGAQSLWREPGIALRAVRVAWPLELQKKWMIPAESTVSTFSFDSKG